MSESSTPDLISTRYCLTEADLYAAQVRHGGWFLQVTRIVGGILAAAGLTGMLVVHQYAGPLYLIVIGALPILQPRLSAKLAFRRDFASQLETTVAASESGIEFLNSKGDSRLNWSAFVRYSETKSVFMLYVQSNFFQVIPKRALSPGDVSAFQVMLQRCLVSRPKSFAERLNPRMILFFSIVAIAIVLMTLAIYRINHPRY